MDLGRGSLFISLLLLFTCLFGCQGKKGAGRGGGGEDTTASFGPCLTSNPDLASVSSILGGSFESEVTSVSTTSATVVSPVPATPGKLIEVSGSGFQCDVDVEIGVGGTTVIATPITINAGQIIFAFPAVAALGLDYTAAPDARVMDLLIPTDGGTLTITGAFYLPKILLVDDQSPLVDPVPGGVSNTSTLPLWEAALDTLVGSAAYDTVTAASVSATSLSENEVVLWFAGGTDDADFFTGGFPASGFPPSPPHPSDAGRTSIEGYIGTDKVPFPGVSISGFFLSSSVSLVLADGFPTVAPSTIGLPPAYGVYSGFLDLSGSSFFGAVGVSEMFYNFAYFYGAILGFASNAWYVVNTPSSGSILSTLPEGYTFTCNTPIWEYFTTACANTFPMTGLYAHMESPVDYSGAGAGTGLVPGFSPVWSFTAAYYGATCEGGYVPPGSACEALPAGTCYFFLADGSAGFGGVQSDTLPKSAMHAGVTGLTNVAFSGIPIAALLANSITTGAGGYPLPGPGNMGSPEIFAGFLANLLVFLHDGDVPVGAF